MSVIVQKFGGTSVADAGKLRAAARRAVDARRAGNQVVMVVSARGKKTDELIGLAAEITETPPPREMDMLLSTGEQESVALMAMAVRELGEEAISFTGAQIGIATDSSHTKARIQSISTERMRQALEAGNIVIAAGFQGVDENFNITTLGRGGSDTTAAALAAVLQADVCEIYTDVEGVFTTDPRLVPEARKIERISYDEMLELASMGAGVMHSRAIEFAKKYRVPLRVRPSYSDGAGTLIAPRVDEEHAPMVTGVALVRDEARVTLCDIPDRPGVMSLIFAKMAERRIPIDMVVQDVGSHGLAETSFTVPENELAEALTAAHEAVNELGAGSVQHGTNVAKVSAVGMGMKTHTGVAARLFRSLAEAGIEARMVSTSEIKISVLVDRDACGETAQALHEGFALHNESLEAGFPGGPTPAGTHSGASRDELERDVVARLATMEDIVVSDVRLDAEQARVTIGNLPDVRGVAAGVFSAVSEGGILVDLIVQNVSHTGRSHLSFTVPRDSLPTCLDLARNALTQWPEAELTSQREIALLSVVGIGLQSHTGVGEKMFRALAEADINIQMISTSEICMSAVVAAAQGEKGHSGLTETFGL